MRSEPATVNRPASSVLLGLMALCVTLLAAMVELSADGISADEYADGGIVKAGAGAPAQFSGDAPPLHHEPFAALPVPVYITASAAIAVETDSPLLRPVLEYAPKIPPPAFVG